MPTAKREEALTEAFVDLADSLVSDFDVVDLLHRLVNLVTSLFEADAAGLLLSDMRGNLQLLASSTEATRLLELFQLQNEEGPCLDCFRSGQPVSVADLDDVRERWPLFVPAAREQGFAAVHALPMRLRDEVIGALNLFTAQPGSLSLVDLKAAQGLADVATIGILQDRATQQRNIVVEQTEALLHDRVVIEQAKGTIAASGPAMDEALAILRRYAARVDRHLADVALDLAQGRLSPADVLPLGRPKLAPATDDARTAD